MPASHIASKKANDAVYILGEVVENVRAVCRGLLIVPIDL
jgi:hypothetical protein